MTPKCCVPAKLAFGDDADLNIFDGTMHVSDDVRVNDSGYVLIAGGALNVGDEVEVNDNGTVKLDGGKVAIGASEPVPNSVDLYIGSFGIVDVNGGDVDVGTHTIGIELDDNLKNPFKSALRVAAAGNVDIGDAQLLVDPRVYEKPGFTLDVNEYEHFFLAQGTTGRFDSVAVHDHSTLVFTRDEDGKDWALAVKYTTSYVIATVALPGDVDLDKDVDSDDADIIVLNWQAINSTWSDGDMDGDGDVDSADLTIVGLNLGRTSP